MKTSPALLALGLTSSAAHLAAAAPVPIVAVSEWASHIRASVHGVILPAPRLPVNGADADTESATPTPPLSPPPQAAAGLTVDATNAYEHALGAPAQLPLVIDNRPVTPSATVPPRVALAAPVPIHTTYLLALARHPHLLRGQGLAGIEGVSVSVRVRGDEAEAARAEGEGEGEEDDGVVVPDTVSPTSYARIEAGLAELHPPSMGMSCWHRGVAGSRIAHQHGIVVVGFVASFLLVLLLAEAWASIAPR